MARKYKDILVGRRFYHEYKMKGRALLEIP